MSRRRPGLLAGETGPRGPCCGGGGRQVPRRAAGGGSWWGKRAWCAVVADCVRVLLLREREGVEGVELELSRVIVAGDVRGVAAVRGGAGEGEEREGRGQEEGGCWDCGEGGGAGGRGRVSEELRGAGAAWVSGEALALRMAERKRSLLE